uniref:Uncharacterized protein n=1 Tax=Strongyloides venezuelensis TaxID=75913 RepID=A0A0K0FRJ4_STRVS
MFEDSNFVESRLTDDSSEDSQSDISKNTGNVSKEQPTEEDLLDLGMFFFLDRLYYPNLPSILVNEIYIALTSKDVTSSPEKSSGGLSFLLDKYVKQLKNPRQHGKNNLNESNEKVRSIVTSATPTPLFTKMSKQCGSTVSTAITPYKSSNTTAKRSMNKTPLLAKNVGSHELLCPQTKTTTPNTQKLIKGIKRPREGFETQLKKIRVPSDNTKIYVPPVIKVSDDLKKTLQQANKNNEKDKHSYPLLNLNDTKHLLTDESDDETDRESIMDVNKKASIVSNVPPGTIITSGDYSLNIVNNDRRLDLITIEIRGKNGGF